MFNVIRFFEAAPVLLLPDLALKAPSLPEVAAAWECVLCLHQREDRVTGRGGWGVALPATEFQVSHSNDLGEMAPAFASAKKPVLITTAGDLPGALEVKSLAETIGRWKALSASANAA